MAKQPVNTTSKSSVKKSTTRRKPTTNNHKIAPEVKERLDRLENYIAIIAEPIAKRNDPNRTRWQRIADLLETSTPSRIVVGLGPLLALFSFLGILTAVWSVNLQYQSSLEERVARAWQTLAVKGLGNGGKVHAIEYLHEKEQNLDGINFGGNSRSTGPYLNGLELNNADISYGNWNYARIENSELSGIHLTNIKLDNSISSGLWKEVIISSSSGRNSIFKLKFNSEIIINDSVFDFAMLPFYWYVLNTSFTSNAHENDSVDFDFYARNGGANLSDVNSVYDFRNVSLRCAFLPLESGLDLVAWNVNISGAYLGDPDLSKSHANLSETEWSRFDESWYFLDNKPVGVPKEMLAKYFKSVDRNKKLASCGIDPINNGHVGINKGSLVDAKSDKAECISLLVMPQACKRNFNEVHDRFSDPIDNWWKFGFISETSSGTGSEIFPN